ncbi:hypothetical protein ACFL16_00385 [Patescibacteria group bacterium]
MKKVLVKQLVLFGMLLLASWVVFEKVYPETVLLILLVNLFSTTVLWIRIRMSRETVNRKTVKKKRRLPVRCGSDFDKTGAIDVEFKVTSEFQKPLGE